MESKRQKLESFNVELVDDVLIKIFDLLTVQERIPAKLVCSSWNRVLSHHRFTSQNWFMLKNCFISEKCPPWTIIRNLDQPITNLHVGQRIIYDESDEQIEEKFYKEIGPDVLRLSTSSCFHRLPLHSFTGLKELKLDCELSEVKLSAIPETVEVLCVKLCNENSSLNTLRPLRNAKKNLKVLTMSTIDVSVFNYGPFTFSPKVHDLGNTLYGLYFSCKELSFYPIVRPNINFLDPDLVFIDLPDLVKLTEANPVNSVNLRKMIPDFMSMTNLKWINLQMGSQACFLPHSEMSMPNISAVKITSEYMMYSFVEYRDTMCRECLQNLVKGFPGIKEFSFYLLQTPQMEGLLNAFKDKLIKLKIYAVHKAKLPIMPNIQSVRIYKYPIDSSNELFEVCSKMPNVVEAGMFDFDFEFGEAELETLGKCWPKLKYLDIKLGGKYEQFACRTAQKYFKNLVHVKGFDSENENSVMETFEQIPTLRTWSNNFTYGNYCQRKYSS